MKSPNGFLEYGESDAAWQGGINSVILSTKCTSLAEIQAAGLVEYGNGAGQQTYNSSGMLGNAAATAGLKIDSGTTSNATYAARVAQLKNAGHITLWVENSVADVTNPPAISGRGMIAFGSAFFPEVQRSLNAQVQCLFQNNFAGNIGSGAPAESLYGTPVGKDGRSRIDIAWVSNFGAVNYNMTADLFINGQLIQRSTGSAQPNWDHTQLNFWTRYWGGDGITNSAGRLYAIQVSTRPIFLPFARPSLDIATLGDSLTVNASIINGTPYLHDTTHGGQYGVAGFIHGIRRLFYERGLMPAIFNYAVVGQTSANFAAQITSCFTTDKKKPKYVWVQFGANDATGGVSDTTFDTNMRNGLTSLFNTHGVSKVFIGKPPSVAWLASATQTQKDAIVAYGVKIEAMKASYPNLVVIDSFTALGGHSDETFFRNGDGTIDQHPNSKGNKAIQDLLLPAMRTNINWNA